MALVDYFLKIDGIDGESADKTYAKWIEISSFSWGATQSATTGGTGGGGGAGKVSLQDFHFVMNFQKASPLLFKSCATGEHIKSGILVGRNNRTGQEDFLKITLSDLLVSSYQAGGSSDIVPTDQVSLNFSKIEIGSVRFDGTTNTIE
jgi:type VI secretion system secreted protein Hcp